MQDRTESVNKKLFSAIHNVCKHGLHYSVTDDISITRSERSTKKLYFLSRRRLSMQSLGSWLTWFTFIDIVVTCSIFKLIKQVKGLTNTMTSAEARVYGSARAY